MKRDRCSCGFGAGPHPADACPLRIEGILRVGDILQTFKKGDHELLTAPPCSPTGRPDPSYPWPCTIFPLGFQDEAPFEHIVPADFAERAAREGRILPADPWSTWTEPPPVWAPAPPATEDATP